MHHVMRTMIAISLLLCSSASAKQKKQLAHPLEMVFSTAIRFIRVDNNFTIEEKDKDGGYILFTYGSKNGSRNRATLELLARGDQKSPKTIAIVGIQHVPSYLEVDFLEKLEKKLRKESQY